MAQLFYNQKCLGTIDKKVFGKIRERLKKVSKKEVCLEISEKYQKILKTQLINKKTKWWMEMLNFF